MGGVILGPERELTVVLAAVEDARSGQGRVVLIEGEAGIGKTCLVEAGLAGLGDGFEILRMRAHELDRHRPFGAFVEPLTRSPGRAHSETAEFARLLVDDAPRTDLHLMHEPGDRLPLLEAILAALERLWTSGPLLLVVEDVQWADPESLTCLYHVARRVPAARVAVLLTYRPNPRRPELDALIAGLMGSRALDISLGPLDRPAVSDLAAQILGARPGASLVLQLARTGGNPLFVSALLEALQEEGVLEVRDATSTGAGTSSRPRFVSRSCAGCPPCPSLVSRCFAWPRSWARASPRTTSASLPGGRWRSLRLRCARGSRPGSCTSRATSSPFVTTWCGMRSTRTSPAGCAERCTSPPARPWRRLAPLPPGWPRTSSAGLSQVTRVRSSG